MSYGSFSISIDSSLGVIELVVFGVIVKLFSLLVFVLPYLNHFLNDFLIFRLGTYFLRKLSFSCDSSYSTLLTLSSSRSFSNEIYVELKSVFSLNLLNLFTSLYSSYTLSGLS